MSGVTQTSNNRQRFLEYYQKHKGEKSVTVTSVCIMHHTCRKTFYKWQERWDGKAESLADRSIASYKMRQRLTCEHLKLIKGLAKKYHWWDILWAYLEVAQ